MLAEPWFAGSHRAWAEGFRRHSRHDVELVVSEPGGWRSTIEQSASALAGKISSTPDLLLASSMMDLAELKARSGLDVPVLLYMHENQLTYHRARPDLELGGVNWRSVGAADRVAFNSRFHLDDFFTAVPGLDADHTAIARARDKSLVLPVGIDVIGLAGLDERDGGPPVVLWNHRWESDKDPATFIEAVSGLADVSFRLILAGGGSGAAHHTAALLDLFGGRVLHAGLAPPELYPELLRRADVVVSTARQEFFGVSIAEAMSCGVVPVVPNRLAYPELLGTELAPHCLYEPGELTAALESMLVDAPRRTSLRSAAERAGRRFDWRLMAPLYDELIDSMV